MLRCRRVRGRGLGGRRSASAGAGRRGRRRGRRQAAMTGGVGRTPLASPGSMRPMNSPSASCTDWAACCSAASFSWISASSGSGGSVGLQVEHQPVLVGGHRLQREQLRRDRLLQVDHQPHHARLVLADPHAGDVGIVAADLADDLAQRRAQLEAVDIDHQPRRAVDQEVAGLQRGVAFERDAGVVVGRPDPHRDDAGAEGDLGRPEQQRQRAEGAECGAAIDRAGVMAAAPGRAACAP